MAHPARIGLSTIITYLVMQSLLPMTTASGQVESPSINPTPSAPPDAPIDDRHTGVPDSDVPDDFESLLNLAETDVAQLATVKVAVPAFDTVVSTVSRQESTVGRSPAAVFVITNEMIHRSGARSVPEALRLAPGVDVARISANKWAVSIRGFGGRFTNKLLVQIDGRTVYTPQFAGVFWDTQDVLLEDVERIEVIRGPGATVWGANAVNGVINILTKKSEDTQGTFVESGGGTERAFTSVRHGTQIGDNAWLRVYGKWFERDAGGLETQGCVSGFDDSRQGRGGFRIDWLPEEDTRVTVQGDVYDGSSGLKEFFPGRFPNVLNESVYEEDVSGGNVLTRLSHSFDADNGWDLQLYYDRIERIPAGFPRFIKRDIVDVDFQSRLKPADNHQLIWGLGYRFYQDDPGDPPAFFLSFQDPNKQYDVFSAFLQDEITLVEDELFLTLGSKLTHNDFSGLEMQPSARALWMLSPAKAVWAAVSRAVRTPSRIENDGRYPMLGFPFAPIMGNPPAAYLVQFGNSGVDSEVLIAWEMGYREQVTETLAWDLALFFNDYDRLLNASNLMPMTGPEGTVLPSVFGNGGEGQSYGFEVSGSWQVIPDVKLMAAYNFLRTDVDRTTQPTDARNQFYLNTSWDLAPDVQFDSFLRYVDNQYAAPSYTTVDLRLAWMPKDSMEIFAVARHLLDQEHPELVRDPVSRTSGTEVEREVFGGVALRF